jgi:hypothetical protein
MTKEITRSLVHITSVRAAPDPVLPDRVMYTLLLSCGCSLLEHQDHKAIAPTVGTEVHCYRDHTGWSDILIKE